jgi:hypothetical protein
MDYSRHLTRFSLCNLAVSPRFLQGFHKKIAWPTDTRFSMVAAPFRELVELIVCEFAILDDGFADEQKLGVVVMAHEDDYGTRRRRKKDGDGKQGK